MEPFFFDAIGVMGVLGYLGSYIKLQLKREYAKSFQYSMINFLSAFCVFTSLMYSYNLFAVLIQISWALVSVYGMYRCLKYVRKEKMTAGSNQARKKRAGKSNRKRVAKIPA